MFNINYLLVKSIQSDHLRDAQQHRLARLMKLQQQAARKVYRRKAKSSNG